MREVEKPGRGAGLLLFQSPPRPPASSSACPEFLRRRQSSVFTQLFIALCRRYGIKPFRYRRMHKQTVVVKAPRSFVEQVLWPEFEELSNKLTAYLAEVTEKLIREEVHGETTDAEGG